MQENLEGIHNLNELKLRFKNFELETRFELETQGERVEKVITKWQGKLPEDWRIVRGSRILDLGCGTALPDYCYVYPPYFCRLMTMNGAQVFGVDRFAALDEDNQIFSHIQANFVDLTSNGRLKDLFPLQSKLFNIIHVWRLIETNDPNWEESFKNSGLSMEQFFKLLVSQANDLLLEDGLLVVENEFFRKEDIGLISI